MAMRTGRLPLLIVAAASAACGTAVAPDRQQTYEFAEPLSGLTYHWTSDQLPVRYWVAPDAGAVREFVQEGLDAWSDQFLYGEFRGILVPDSADADVVVVVTPPPPEGGPTNDPPVPGACRGITRYELAPDENRLAGPFRVAIDWDVRYPDVDVVNCLERVTIHEIGHTIGIFGHSPNEADLMYAAPQVNRPSEHDRQTAEILYHTPRTILPR
jgi:predicted Zn-dependent protease